ncbi:hypothetical protein V499_08055 [Pseudogymnoascus sp. VKM F-103]|nr:hypothetical protein V499_08055 [Pseudogymnoascus sp. VKM F-103]
MRGGKRGVPVECASEDNVFVRAEFRQPLRKIALVDQTTSLIDNKKRKDDPIPLSAPGQSAHGVGATRRLAIEGPTAASTPDFGSRRQGLNLPASPQRDKETTARLLLPHASNLPTSYTSPHSPSPLLATTTDPPRKNYSPGPRHNLSIHPDRTNPSTPPIMSTNAAQTMRKRAPPQGDEEAGAELKLGEFQDVDALTHSEAALVINALVAKRKMDKDSKRVNDSEMLNKTLEYLDHFARFKRKENVEAVERLLSAHPELAKFERAQLGSLCCELAEEAKTLVPSLADKISDDDLQELLNEINKHRGYDG